MTLCLDCARADAGWRDAPISVIDGGVTWLDNGNANTVRAALERRERRIERYYELVRFQRGLIARLCAERHDSQVQLDLFGEAA